jgi:putative flippase GtrA
MKLAALTIFAILHHPSIHTLTSKRLRRIKHEAAPAHQAHVRLDEQESIMRLISCHIRTREPKMPLLSSRFVRFILTGGIAAATNALSRILFSLAFTFEIAVVVAYLTGMVTAFVLFRVFVFERSGLSKSQEFLRFTTVNVVALIQVWAVSIGLANYALPAIAFTWNAELVAHLIGICIPVVSSYYGHKYFSFERKLNAS